MSEIRLTVEETKNVAEVLPLMRLEWAVGGVKRKSYSGARVMTPNLKGDLLSMRRVAPTIALDFEHRLCVLQVVEIRENLKVNLYYGDDDGESKREAVRQLGAVKSLAAKMGWQI